MSSPNIKKLTFSLSTYLDIALFRPIIGFDALPILGGVLTSTLNCYLFIELNSSHLSTPDIIFLPPSVSTLKPFKSGKTSNN